MTECFKLNILYTKVKDKVYGLPVLEILYVATRIRTHHGLFVKPESTFHKTILNSIRDVSLGCFERTAPKFLKNIQKNV